MNNEKFSALVKEQKQKKLISTLRDKSSRRYSCTDGYFRDCCSGCQYLNAAKNNAGSTQGGGACQHQNRI